MSALACNESIPPMPEVLERTGATYRRLDEFERQIASQFDGRFTVVGECWEFDGYREGGYGRISMPGPKPQKRELLHRHVLSLLLGRPLREKALHRCDNPPCFRPRHLYEGDQRQNAADRAASGHTATGERHGKARLTAEQVHAIRAAYAAGGTSHRKLAAKYGITYQSIAAIVTRKTWRLVTR